MADLSVAHKKTGRASLTVMDTILAFLTMPCGCPIGDPGKLWLFSTNWQRILSLGGTFSFPETLLQRTCVIWISISSLSRLVFCFLLFAEPLPVFNRPSQVCLWEKAAAHKTSRCFLWPTQPRPVPSGAPRPLQPAWHQRGGRKGRQAGDPHPATVPAWLSRSPPGSPEQRPCQVTQLTLEQRPSAAHNL